MSKYHIRDKFVIEIDEVFENDADDFIHEEKLYRIKGFNSLVFDDNGLDKLQKYETFTVRPDAWDESLKEQYNKGLEDAWELVNKINSFDTDKLYDVYKTVVRKDIFLYFTPQEALAKLEAYEKEKEEIKVGNVVEFESIKQKYVVLAIYNNEIWAYKIGNKDNPLQNLGNAQLKKTGKHIDLADLFKQIGGDK